MSRAVPVVIAAPLLPFGAAVLAQAVPLPPPAAATLRPPTEQELRREPATQAPASAPKVTIRTRGAVKEGPCPAALLDSPLKVSLQQVVFTGANGKPLPPEIMRALAPAALGATGTDEPIRIVCDVRNAANAALSRAGYVAAVRVPDQTLQSGKLVLEVITARIVDIRVRGDAGANRHRIETLLDKLRTLDPLNTRDAERIMLLAGDTPGLSLTLELNPAPNGVAGEVVGDITIERTRGSLLLNMQDYGSQQIGRFGGLARAEVYGLTGLGDRTYASVFTTTDIKEQQVVQVGHDMLLTGNGLHLSGEFTYAWTRPDLSSFGGAIDLRSKAILGRVELSYPVLRSLGANATVGGGFDYIDQRVRTSGVPINTDKMRIFYLRANGDVNDRPASGLAPAWHIGGSIELRKGTDILSASKLGVASGGAFTTRFEGDPQAFELRGSYQTELRARFGPNRTYAVTAAVDARGQWSNHPLLAFEELAVGNLTIGRGYDPGVTSADRAVGASFELRAGKPLPQSRKDLAFEAFGFYDAVRIWNLDTGSTETDRSLRSVGGGLRVSWGDHARLDLAYAHPLDKALSFDARRASDRFLFSLVLRALPWRR